MSVLMTGMMPQAASRIDSVESSVKLLEEQMEHRLKFQDLPASSLPANACSRCVHGYFHVCEVQAVRLPQSRANCCVPQRASRVCSFLTSSHMDSGGGAARRAIRTSLQSSQASRNQPVTKSFIDHV